MKQNKKNHKNGHFNKYQDKVPKKKLPYDPRDKTYRSLPIIGKPGVMIEKGFRVIFHGRVYALRNTIILSNSGDAIAPFKLVGYLL